MNKGGGIERTAKETVGSCGCGTRCDDSGQNKGNMGAARDKCNNCKCCSGPGGSTIGVTVSKSMTNITGWRCATDWLSKEVIDNGGKIKSVFDTVDKKYLLFTSFILKKYFRGLHF